MVCLFRKSRLRNNEAIKTKCVSVFAKILADDVPDKTFSVFEGIRISTESSDAQSSVSLSGLFRKSWFDTGQSSSHCRLNDDSCRSAK